jgi:hypothetical protein
MCETRRFTVYCRACGFNLLTTDRIRDPEIDDVLVTHLRACAASEPLGEAPMLGTIMRRLRIEALKV